jgi:3-carboxy-cis,cis-muconate cycloisomerase
MSSAEAIIINVQHTHHLFDAFFATEQTRAIFSDQGTVQCMLDFEAALAQVEAGFSIIPLSAAETIAATCQVDRFDLGALANEAAEAGNLAIPLIRALTALVAHRDQDAARYVHWGATSQDVIDTGLMLQVRGALDLVESELTTLADACAEIAREYKMIPLAGRTWLQQATPTTFGLKVAGWLNALDSHRDRFRVLRAGALAIQFGGAVGTLASLDSHGLDVATALADRLGLALPDLPWHTQRDRVAEVATTFGLLVGTLGKIARDISLMMQTEIGEAFEPSAPGRGGSSTMPQKRNPVGCAITLAVAQRVPSLVATMLVSEIQEHERGLGGWHAEWETLPEICTLSAAALHQMAIVVKGLEVDRERMRANLDSTQGQIFAEAIAMTLAPHMGRQAALDRVKRACNQAVKKKQHLRDVLTEDTAVMAYLTVDDLDRLFAPENAVGLAVQLVDRALSRHATHI